MSKAILLFSGGLDSIVSYFTLLDAGLEQVIPIFFETPFFLSSKAKYYASKNNISLFVHKIFPRYRKILLYPQYGYGKNMNPCIDCHAFMFESAIRLLEKYNADFIATGEVIGQRPMSQNKRAMGIIEDMIEKGDSILRPLSAKLLPKTWMERQGLVDRNKLYGIMGRSRTKQMDIAKKMGIKDYASPAGGCLLTEREYAKKLKMLIEKKIFNKNHCELIKYGRIVEYKNGIGIIGRNHEENMLLRHYAKKYKKYQIKHEKGPIGVLIGDVNEKEKKVFLEKIIQYSKKYEENNNIITFI